MLARFLQTLADDGLAELPWPGRDLETSIAAIGKDEADKRASLRLLESWHREAVLDLPGHRLSFHPRAALWGAVMLFRASAFMTFREVEESAIIRMLPDHPLPDAETVEAIFSADLTLRLWPRLARMARARSEDDPLLKAMQRVAEAVPLSALGMQLEVDPRHPLFRHAGVAQFFAERALERADHPCLRLPEVAALIRMKLGSYSSLFAPGLLSPATIVSES